MTESSSRRRSALRDVATPRIPLDGYLEAVLEACDGVAFAQDLEGLVVAWSDQAVELYGFSAIEVVEGPAARLVPPDRLEEHAEILRRSALGERTVWRATERVRRDGSRITLSITTAPIRDAHGDVAGVAVVANDRAELRRAEEHVSRLTSELAERTRERNSLHGLASSVQDRRQSDAAMLADVAANLPAATKVPHAAGVRIAIGGRVFASPRYRDSDVALRVERTTPAGETLTIDLVYVEPLPTLPPSEAFLREDRDLLESVADVLQLHLERAHVERALVSQIRLLDAFFQHSVTPLVILDREFRFVRVNEAYARACARPASDFPGRNHFDLYPSELRSRFEDVVRTKQPLSVVAHPFVFVDHPEWGTTYWNWTLVPILDDDGECEFLVFSLLDVTEAKRTAMELERSEQDARRRLLEIEQIYRYAPVGLYTLDRGHRFVRINERMASINGLPVEQHIGRTLREVVPDLADRLIEAFRPVLERGIPVLGIEIHGSTPGTPGIERDWLCSYFPFTGPGGEISGLTGAVLDITDRKRMEADLRRSEASLARAQQMTHLGSWEWIVDKGELRWSDETYRILGYEPGRVTPSYARFLDRVHPEDREAVSGTVTRALQSPDPCQIDHRVVVSDGTQRVVHSEAAAFFDASGKALRVVGTIQDVSDRAQSERMRREVVAMLTHDLKNPLSVILGLAELLRDDPPECEEERLRFYDRIEVNARRAVDLAINFIEASRIESEPIRVLREPVSLNDLVDAAVKNQATLARTRGVLLETRLAPNVPRLAIDPRMIDRVIVNLLDNAISFTPSGKHVVVATEVRPPEVIFSVADEGPGIPPEAREALFRSFRQIASSSTRKGTSGLGLFIVKTLVEAHDGRVSARWPEKGGTVFEVALPLVPIG